MVACNLATMVTRSHAERKETPQTFNAKRRSTQVVFKIAQLAHIPISAVISVLHV